MSETKIIYNKQYSLFNGNDLDNEFENMTSEEFKLGFIKFLQEFEKEIIYKLNRKKKKHKKGFIDLAKIISQEFRISTKIWEDKHSVHVEFFQEYGPINKWHKIFLGRLITLSDIVDFAQETDGFTVNLVYCIYDMYYNNKKIEL